jgi:ubiquinone/menaquinone biosynthesis C-methylase UbiE
MTSRFDEKARDWDTPERVERAREAASAIRRHVPLDPSMRVIDLGAGTGLLGLALANAVASVTLAEPSAGMLEVTREKLADDGPANVTAIEFDLPGDPPPGAPFDLAVSLLVLHHVEDTAALLRSVHDLLVPGGRIALLDLDAEDGSFHSEDAEGIHHHGFDQAHLVETAAAAGFGDVGVRNVMHIAQNGRPYPVFLLTGRRPTT